jgi:hypothetical protein
MGNTYLDNWIPYKLIKQDGHIYCHWLNTYSEPFTRPFFKETILKCKSIHNNKLFFSSVSDLLSMNEWAADLNEVNPAAFIFHMSRCGSTLVSQLLATSDENIVLSEAPFFDDILRLPYKTPDFDQTAINELLTAAIKYYGQERTATNNPVGNKKKRVFIKTDSWHLFFYKQLRQLYPLTPFVFIYRRPDEVLRSHIKLRGMQAVPGLIEPEVFGFKKDEPFLGLDVYLSQVLESYFKQCLEIIKNDKNFLLLNYNDGPMPMMEKIADFTHTALSAKDRANMTERSLYHSKKPGELFSEVAVDHITPYLDNAMELYHKLEEKKSAILFS